MIYLSILYKSCMPLHNHINVVCLRNVSKVSKSSFQASKIKFENIVSGGEIPQSSDLIFGRTFAANMLTIDWNKRDGWCDPVIHKLENLQLHPAAKVFHYAIECYEGLKAYYQAETNSISLFRPELNFERFLETSKRLCLPEFDPKELLKCTMELINTDKRWVPTDEMTSLYIRPTFIASDTSLGIDVSERAKMFVITGPVGAYYKTGTNAIRLFADPFNVRACKGGTGSYKMGANYPATIHTQREAARKYNAQQVLWLNGDDHQLTEVGTMNLFIYWRNEDGENELITPPLDGIILPGITRKSVLDLAQDWEFKVTERNINMEQLIKASKENRILSIFGTGTACMISLVKEIIYKDVLLKIPVDEAQNSLTNRLTSTLTKIQYGRIKNEWNRHVCNLKKN